MPTRLITINLSRVSGSHTDFPVMISGTYPFLRTEANGGQVVNSNGFDIEFISAITNERLNWEMLKYIPTTGEIIAFVKLPSLSSTGHTPFFIRYGSNITSNVGNPTQVWTNNYISVYHLGDGSTLGLSDSTSNNNTLVNNNGVTAITGRLYGGASFNAASSQSLYGGTTISNDLEFTVSAWVRVASYPSTEVNIAGMLNGVDSGFVDKQLRLLASSGTPTFYNYRAAARYATSVAGAMGTNTWVYLVGTTSNTANQGRIFVNGSLQGTNSGSNVTGYSVANLYIGGRGINPYSSLYGDFYTGDVSEVRFSSAARSADWISTEYNTQADPSSFFSISQFEAGGYITGITTIQNISSINF